MVLAFLFGVMEQNIKDLLLTIKSTDKENILGQIKGDMKESGKKIKWMEKELLFGLMVKNI